MDAAASVRTGSQSGLLPVSDHRRADDRRLSRLDWRRRRAVPGEAKGEDGKRCVRQNRVVLAPVAGVKLSKKRKRKRQ